MRSIALYIRTYKSIIIEIGSAQRSLYSLVQEEDTLESILEYLEKYTGLPGEFLVSEQQTMSESSPFSTGMDFRAIACNRCDSSGTRF